MIIITLTVTIIKMISRFCKIHAQVKIPNNINNNNMIMTNMMILIMMMMMMMMMMMIIILTDISQELAINFSFYFNCLAWVRNICHKILENGNKHKFFWIKYLHPFLHLHIHVWSPNRILRIFSTYTEFVDQSKNSVPLLQYWDLVKIIIMIKLFHIVYNPQVF